MTNRQFTCPVCRAQWMMKLTERTEREIGIKGGGLPREVKCYDCDRRLLSIRLEEAAGWHRQQVALRDHLDREIGDLQRYIRQFRMRLAHWLKGDLGVFEAEVQEVETAADALDAAACHLERRFKEREGDVASEE